MSGERVVASSKKVEFKGGVISDTPLTATQAADIENLIPIPHQTTGLRAREGVAPVEDLDPTATGDIAVVKVITMADKPQTRLLAVVDASGETVEVLAENRDTYGRMDPVIGVEKATIPVAWGGSWFGTDGGANARGKYIVVSFWSPPGGFCVWHMFKTTGVFDYSDILSDVFVVRVSANRLAIYNSGYMDFYDTDAAIAAGGFNSAGGADGVDFATAGYVDPDDLDVVIHSPLGTADLTGAAAFPAGYDIEAVSVDRSGAYVLVSSSDIDDADQPHEFRVVNTSSYAVTSTQYAIPTPAGDVALIGKTWGNVFNSAGLVTAGLVYSLTVGATTTYHAKFMSVNPKTGAAVGDGVTFDFPEGEGTSFWAAPCYITGYGMVFHDHGGILVNDAATTATAIPDVDDLTGVQTTAPMLSTTTQILVWCNDDAAEDKYTLLDASGVQTDLASGPDDWDIPGTGPCRACRVNGSVIGYHNAKTDPTTAYTQVANTDYYGLEAIDVVEGSCAIDVTYYNSSVGVIDAFLYYRNYIAGTLT